MDIELKKLIKEFNATQEKAVNVLESELSCPRPKSTNDYIDRCVEIILESESVSNKYRIYPHGYGMSIVINGVFIDFDFGEDGEIDGFDPYRLFSFALNNNFNTALDTIEKIQSAVDTAVSEGSILKSDYINYYLKSQ